MLTGIKAAGSQISGLAERWCATFGATNGGRPSSCFSPRADSSLTRLGSYGVSSALPSQREPSLQGTGGRVHADPSR